MKRVFICFLGMVILSGCMFGPNYQRPDLVTPELYHEPAPSGESIANLLWWELYQDKTLQEFIRIALIENKNLGVAFERINEARASLGFTRADQFPFIDYSGGISKKKFPDEAQSSLSREIAVISADAFFELDLWGKLRRSTEAARAQLLATEEAYRSLTISLVSEVANSYFLIRDLDQQLAITRRTLASRAGSTQIINERLKQGFVPELDLNQAQIEEADAAITVHQLERAIGQAENALGILLGRPPGQIKRGSVLTRQTLPPAIPSGLPSELIQRRPDVLQAEQELVAQNARIGVAQALRFPSIGLTASYGIESPDLSHFDPGESHFWSVGGDVFGPFLSYNKNVRRVDIERARTEQLVRTYEQSILQAFREVEDSLVAVRTYRDQHSVVSKQLAAAKNAAKLSRARYDAGETNYLEVLDSERSFFRAELSESETLRNYIVSVVSLYKALGGGWEVEKPAVKKEG